MAAAEAHCARTAGAAAGTAAVAAAGDCTAAAGTPAGHSLGGSSEPTAGQLAAAWGRRAAEEDRPVAGRGHGGLAATEGRGSRLAGQELVGLHRARDSGDYNPWAGLEEGHCTRRDAGREETRESRRGRDRRPYHRERHHLGAGLDAEGAAHIRTADSAEGSWRAAGPWEEEEAAEGTGTAGFPPYCLGASATGWWPALSGGVRGNERVGGWQRRIQGARNERRSLQWAKMG